MTYKTSIPSKTDINKLRKKDASTLLQSLNLPCDGSRDVLLERLVRHYYTSHTTPTNKSIPSNPVPSNPVPSKSIPSTPVVDNNSNTSKEKIPTKSMIRLMKKDQSLLY